MLQSLCRELMELHDAGILSLAAVVQNSDVKPNKNGGEDYRNDNERNIKNIINFFVNAVGRLAI